MDTCQAPDPNTKKPNITLPPKACDAHCHVFGPDAIFPFHRERSYTPPDAGKEVLKSLHHILGFERAIIVQATCHGDDNSAMLDAIASSGGSYKGIAWLRKQLRKMNWKNFTLAGYAAHGSVSQDIYPDHPILKKSGA
jgi:predicted TIM-barrel fold metal-dependent hydrolase